ncbi:NAD(P)-binding protein [Aspergillus heteromorphus CBS 117.55]|uniref:NAD(P)-binding protein n=1 Tax=Aspergillus heteromorphus CBS 117.55 TaxID=1448321 RepID=A0A317WC75_9EURO|nr:NAD(P)-binding protein [Aspergillus heteromorphus CBS 117.55]PWY83371.1 NAD(P)-binding protein [Aspergillus heteromorphus CBS 117.55]
MGFHNIHLQAVIYASAPLNAPFPLTHMTRVSLLGYAGYRVRAAVRSPEKARRIFATPSIKALAPGDRLSFVQVPDMQVDGAYDEAIKGAQYAIHVASPIHPQNPDIPNLTEYFIHPAIRGSMGLLTSAQQAGSIRRVVITSYTGAILPWSAIVSGQVENVVNENTRVPTPTEYSFHFETYAASKPSFDVFHLFPAFVIGADELVTDATDALRGANREILDSVVLGEDKAIANASVHLDDVAEAHVRCLDPKVPGNGGFILISKGLQGTNWGDSLEITARKFKKEVESGLLQMML